MSRPAPRSGPSSSSYVRLNGKIRAREVRVIGPEGNQLGILSLHEAISLARSRAMDLVEVAPNATPPVCRVVDYGKYRYEQAKREKESRKHQHANRVKEIQLSASIDSHDFEVKLGHAIDFLCEEMKVKLALRFRGREMAHQEFGRDVMARFIKALIPYGYAVETPKLVGRGLNAMLTPLPRNKRAKNPRAPEASTSPDAEEVLEVEEPTDSEEGVETEAPAGTEATGSEGAAGGFSNSPFAGIDRQIRDRPAA